MIYLAILLASCLQVQTAIMLETTNFSLKVVQPRYSVIITFSFLKKRRKMSELTQITSLSSKMLRMLSSSSAVRRL